VKYIHVVATKMTTNGKKLPLLKLEFSIFLLPKLKNILVNNICNFAIDFDPNGI